VLGPVESVEEVDSTNRVLLERARAGAPAGAVLVADHQTAGRGRLERRWEDVPGSSLLVSVLLRPDVASERAHLLTFAAGIAAVEACRTSAGVDVGLKWPNDLVVEVGGGTRKLAGLLAEAVIEGSRLAAVVVGMGMNLQSGSLPDGAVALDELAGRAVARDAVLAVWLERLDEWCTGLDGDRLLERYRRSSATLGRRVRVTLSDETFEGEAVDVNEDGHLLLHTSRGPRHVAAGDVTHLRNVSGA
jgi:BirA family biotin operon repressor/biotin-[acetyl-CoA-carboxylase] ligase